MAFVHLAVALLMYMCKLWHVAAEQLRFCVLQSYGLQSVIECVKSTMCMCISQHACMVRQTGTDNCLTLLWQNAN